MTMTDRAASNGLAELDALLVSSPVTMPLAVLEERPPAPPGVPACSERLPRDVLVRLAALSGQVGHIRQLHPAPPELSLRLENVAAGLAALIQSIYDETAVHLAGRRGGTGVIERDGRGRWIPPVGVSSLLTRRART